VIGDKAIPGADLRKHGAGAVDGASVIRPAHTSESSLGNGMGTRAYTLSTSPLSSNFDSQHVALRID
jgi:hypothetical protein